MKTKHTPGPWQIEETDTTWFIQAKDNSVAVIEKDQGTGQWGNDGANARLIAACPVMLDALEAMLRCPGIANTDQETGETFYDLIKAAIAKATGEKE